MLQPGLGDFSWERVIRAAAKVRQRLVRATTALENLGILHAVIGDHAVSAWVASVDESAVRNTPEVSLLLRRTDLGLASIAFQRQGFIQRFTDKTGLFRDGPNGKVRDAIRIYFSGEKVWAEDEFPAPGVSDVEILGGFRVLRLDALVRMELASFRTLNRVRLDDLLEVGLVDAGWYERLPASLARRLKKLIDRRAADGELAA